jgi:DNA-binding NarL/FixJ family response regulator
MYNQSQMLRVAIVDDQPIVRKGLANVLKKEPGVELVGEAQNGLEAVKLCAQLQPDILISDLKMPKLGGLDLIKRLKALKLDTRVIILSMYGDKAYINSALSAGAKGFVLKKSSISELVQALWAVSNKELYLCTEIQQE